MPDEQGNDLTDEDAVPESSLHAHDEGREDDVVGKPEPEVGDEGDRDEGVAGNPVPDEGDGEEE